MSRKQLCLFAVIALVTGLSTAASAQLANLRPEAGVYGCGTVLFDESAGNYAQFTINVAKVGPSFSGAFHWVEYAGPGVRPVAIQSGRILDMQFLARNHVVVHAVGTLAGRPARIAFELLDDLVIDSVSIRAKSLATQEGVPVSSYENGGGVSKGNVVVFKYPEIITVMGRGVVALKTNVGRFDVKATNSPLGLYGCVVFEEIDPLQTGPTARPVVRIELRKLLMLKAGEGKASMEGVGALNGKPAKVRITVYDNTSPGPGATGIADFFSIQATPTDLTYDLKEYVAEGPVVVGDIVVKTSNPAPPG